MLEVAVFCGEGGDDDAKAQAKPRHEQDEQRQRQCPCGKTNAGTAQGKEGEIRQKKGKLDRKGDQVGNHNRDRHDQAREVDLAKQMSVGSKGGGGAGEATGEVMPHNITGHVKEHLRQSIGGELGDVAENDGEDEGGREGLDDEPQRTQDGLLVTRNKIAPHKQSDQVAVVPHVAQLQIPPLFSWSDDQVPGIIFSCGLSLVHIV